MLALKPLPEAEIVRLIGHYRPDIADGDARTLARLAPAASAGRSTSRPRAGSTSTARCSSCSIRCPNSMRRRSTHSPTSSPVAEAEDSYRTVTELLTQWLARMIRTAAAQNGDGDADEHGEGEIVRGEREGMRRLAARRSLDQWVEVWETSHRLFARRMASTSTAKQVVLGAFLRSRGRLLEASRSGVSVQQN